ncbi:MAG: tetratricopeptide repeat protein [Bacteroidota bacterium]
MANKPPKRPQTQPIPRPAATPRPAAAATPVNEKAKLPADLFSIRNLCIILGVLSFLLYANTLGNLFVMDDVIVLKENTYVLQGAKAIPELFATPHMRGYLVIPNDLYRPFSLVMFALEYELFGLNPMGYHFFNILTFAGCVIMLFLFLDKFFGRQRTALAFIAAAIFAAHPIHTEVVANIKSRDELLCYFFAFWSLNFFMTYMSTGKMSKLVFGVVTLYLSYISKETVITFLAVIPLLFFIYNNENKKRAIYIMAGTGIATVIFLLVRSSVLAAYDANQPGAGVEFIDNALAKAPNAAVKFCTEVVVMGKYLLLMFIPYPLLSTYSFNAIPYADFADYRFWLSLLAYGAMFYFAIKRFMADKKDPWVFAIILFLTGLSLFSNFPFLMGAELAERFAFFASTGFCIAAALAIEKWVIRAPATDVTLIRSSKVLMILVPLIVVFGGMTIARNFDWKDDATLYRADVEKSPNDTRLHHNLATAIAESVYPNEPDTMKRKELDKESITHLRRAMEIYPDYADAHVELGRIYDRMKLYDSAIVHDRRALELNPTNFTANNNLGSVYLTSGRYPQAIELFRKAIVLNPNFKYSYINIARAYGQLKQYDSAIYNLHAYIRLDPQFPEAKQELGTMFYMMQRYDSAEYYFKQILAVNPNEPNAINNLGAIYLNNQRYGEAAEYFKKAVALNPSYINAYSNLGRAYFFNKQYDAAIETFTKELQLDQQNGVRDIPYIALSHQKMGRMDEARKYEAIAKQYYSNFKLE